MREDFENAIGAERSGFEGIRWMDCSTWEHFEKAAARYRDREFVVFDGGGRYTYGDVFDRSLRIAESLDRLGVRSGQHVATYMTNSIDSVSSIFALARLGAVRVALNLSAKPFELSFEIRKSCATVLLCDDAVDFNGVFPESLRLMIARRQSNTASPVLVLPWGSAMSGVGPISAPITMQSPEETDTIMFTSGSTGNPKAVPLTSEMQLITSFENCINRRFEDGRRIFTKLPLFHVFGLLDGLLASVYVGGTLLIGHDGKDWKRDLDFIRSEGANDMMCVPSVMRHYLQILDDTPMDFPDLHAVYCSASPCPIRMWKKIRESFRADELVQGYGMTELAGGVTQIRPGDDDVLLSTRVGPFFRPDEKLMELKGALEHRIVDPDTGAERPNGCTGELQYRGRKVMKGYFQNAAATQKAFTQDGWFKSGDLGRLDENGYLELIGRLDNSYRINGENVSPEFIEGILRQCEAVQEIKIVGIPDERYGAVGMAFVQLDVDVPKARKEFEKFCRESLAGFQVPKYYDYLHDGDWPRTLTGKVRRADLLKRVNAEGADGGKRERRHA